MHNAQPLYTFYESFGYRNTTKMFRKTSWITMRVDVYIKDGKKVYCRQRVRTAELCQDPKTRETYWKRVKNSALNLYQGDVLEVE